MAMLPRMSRTQRENYHYLCETLRELEYHLRGRIAGSGLIPEEWQEIARLRGPMPKVRVTLWVEGDVVKFFKGMGTGHTTRMAEVLRAFRHARLAGLVLGAEGLDLTLDKGEERRHRLSMLREVLGLTAEIEEDEGAADSVRARQRGKPKAG
jgi:uncharacterized protein (DUF4415 family)